MTGKAGVNCLYRSIKRKPLLTPAITKPDENLIAAQLTRGVQTCGAAANIYMCVWQMREGHKYTQRGLLKPLLRCTEKPFVFARPLRAYIRNNSAAHSNSRIHLLRSSQSRLLCLGVPRVVGWLSLGCQSPL
jgi:hypothetical protein